MRLLLEIFCIAFVATILIWTAHYFEAPPILVKVLVGVAVLVIVFRLIQFLRSQLGKDGDS